MKGIEYCPSCSSRMIVRSVRRYYSSIFQSYVQEIVFVCPNCSIKITHYDIL